MSHNTMPQMSQVLRELAIGLLTAGMSTRAAARSFHVNFSTINRLQHRLENLAVRPTGLRTADHVPAQDLHIRLLHLWDRLRPATWTDDEAVGLHNRRISAQTVRNRLREAHLPAWRPHHGLDLTAVQCRN